jgi:hypothetical protein
MRRKYGSELDGEIITNLRSQMRTFRGVIEVYCKLTEAWRVSTGAERDAYSKTF